MRAVQALIAALVVVLCSAGSLMAQQVKVSQETKGMASIGVFTDYLWRGIKLSDGWVVQPSVGIKYKGFGAQLWANWDDDPSDLTETDAMINYTVNIDKFTFSLGYIYYSWEFDGGRPALFFPKDTHELFVSAGYESMMFQPRVTLFADLDDGEGGYLQLSVGHTIDMARDFPSFSLPKNTTVSFGALMGINFDNELVGGGDDYANFHNAELSVGLRMPVTTALTLEPKVAYSFLLSNDARDAARRASFDGERDVFYGGVSLALRF